MEPDLSEKARVMVGEEVIARVVIVVEV